MRLIDADEARGLIKDYGYNVIAHDHFIMCVGDVITDILRIIDGVPTVDSETEIRIQLKESQ